jgi:hypothetical protein
MYLALICWSTRKTILRLSDGLPIFRTGPYVLALLSRDRLEVVTVAQKCSGHGMGTTQKNVDADIAVAADSFENGRNFVRKKQFENGCQKKRFLDFFISSF